MLTRLRVSRRELTRLMANGVLESVTATRSLPADALASGVGLIAGALFKCFAEEPLTNIDLVQLREVGGHWSELGMDKGDQAAVVTTTMAIAYRFVVHAADRSTFPRASDRRAAIEDLGIAVLRTQPLLLHALVARGIELGRRDETDEGAASVIDRLLTASPDEWPIIEADAQALGLSERVGVVVLIAPRPAFEPDLGRVARLVCEATGGASGTQHAQPVPHSALVLAADNEEWGAVIGEVEAAVADTGLLFVAPQSPVALRQIPHSHELCRRNLSFACVVPPRGPRVDLAVLQMCRVKSAAPVLELAQLFQSVAGGLVERRPDLLHLLDALVAVGPYREVEAALGRRERSISRDVGTIKDETGYDWLTGWGRYTLSEVTICRWLAAMSLSGYDEAIWGPLPRTSQLANFGR